MDRQRVALYGDGLSVRLAFAFLQELAEKEKWPLEFSVLDESSKADSFDLIQTDLESCNHFQMMNLNAPAAVNILNCADILIRKQNKWWPRILLLDVLKRLIVHQEDGVDAKKAVFIIGINKLQRVATSVFVSLGFSKVYLVDHDLDIIQKEIEYLNKKFFNITFVPLLEDQLTLQTQCASALVISHDLSNHELLLSDLTYFNFLFPNSLVVDFNVLPLESQLLQEAIRVKMRVIEGTTIVSLYEYEALKLLNLDQKMKFSEFHEQWLQFLRSQTKVQVT